MSQLIQKKALFVTKSLYHNQWLQWNPLHIPIYVHGNM